MATDAPLLTYIGHATVLLQMDGVGVMTDPLLVGRIGPVRRVADPALLAELPRVDLVLLTHAHFDHFSIPSLRRLARHAELVLPRGTGELVRGLGFAAVHEIEAGKELAFGGLVVRAQPAWHRGRRHWMAALTPSIGYEVCGSLSLYHAGDTGEVPALSSFAGPLDVACLPVSGYGARLPEDHMSPESAAAAVAMLRPRLAVPIHWGTYQLSGMTRRMRERDIWRPRAFVAAVKTLESGARARVLEPGESLELTGNTLGQPARRMR
jgi:L-ascorbate metabolism protein UlaG (beta-lactamase superfamily)